MRQKCIIRENRETYVYTSGVASDADYDLTYIYPLAIPRPTKSTDPRSGARSNFHPFTAIVIRSSAALTFRSTRALSGHPEESEGHARLEYDVFISTTFNPSVSMNETSNLSNSIVTFAKIIKSLNDDVLTNLRLGVIRHVICRTIQESLNEFLTRRNGEVRACFDAMRKAH